MAMFFSAFDEEVFLFESMLRYVALGFLYIIGGVFTILGVSQWDVFLTLGVH